MADMTFKVGCVDQFHPPAIDIGQRRAYASSMEPKFPGISACKALSEQRAASMGTWSPEVLAEDERRLAAYREERSGADWSDVRNWMESWGRPSEAPAPKARKL